MQIRSLYPTRVFLLRTNVRHWFTGALILILFVSATAPIVSQRKQTQAKRRLSGNWPINDANILSMETDDRLNKISPEARTALLSTGRGQTAPRRAVANVRGATYYYALNVEFQDETSQKSFKTAGKPGEVGIFNRFDRFADVFIQVNARLAANLNALEAAPGVVWVEDSGVVEVPPPARPVRGPRARGEAEKIVRGGLNGLTGKGVVIAIVDSGLDFRNPDFITYDAQGQPTSRLLYLWDTTSYAFDSRHLGSKPPITYPNGTSVGTLYTRDQLTRELRSSVKRVSATDLNGHGTACAGIAAGNGNNYKGHLDVVGVAPEADIIAVRIGGTEGPVMENAFLLPAIAGWLDSVAGNKPLVVSCSFGGHDGGHDGNLIAERQLNTRFPPGTKGRALVVAAGNEARRPIHAQVRFQGRSAPGRLLYDARDDWGRIEIYLDSDDTSSLKIGLAPGVSAKPCAKFQVNPFTHQAFACIEVGPGFGGIALWDVSGRARKADAYFLSRSYYAGFDSETASVEGLVGSPGTARNAITVGSYDWNDRFEFPTGVLTVLAPCSTRDKVMPIAIGYLSCYSSPGYTRNGEIKPDVAAPGEYYTASYAKLPQGTGVNPRFWKREGPTASVDASGNYVRFEGTSAATPYVAGAIALMFQKKPGLTLGEIKTLLKDKATEDQITGPVPNPKWGNGKLDLAAIERMLAAIR